MFANPKWFARRKWGGWGVYPVTREGWIYLAALILSVLFINTLSLPESTKQTLTFIWTVIVVLDVVLIMIRIKKDELETKMEAIAERNASWALVFVIGAGIVYQSYMSSITGTVQIDPFLFAALIVGLIVKALTHLYLRNKGL